MMDMRLVMNSVRLIASERLQSLRLWTARADVRAALVMTLVLRLFCSLIAALPLAVLPGELLARSGPALRLTWVGVGSGLLMFFLAQFVLWAWVS